MSGLRLIAKADLQYILTGDPKGFRWPIKVKKDANEFDTFGFSNDIALLIDPDTGQAVSGRTISVALDNSLLEASVIGAIPQGIQDESKKPYLVTFEDLNGLETTWKVVHSNPDRGQGLVTLELQAYSAT